MDDGSTRQAPTQMTLHEMMDFAIENGVVFEDSDEEEEFERGGEGAGYAGLDEEAVVREIEVWERKRREMREKKRDDKDGEEKDDDEDDDKKQGDGVMGIGGLSRGLKKGGSESEYSREQ